MSIRYPSRTRPIEELADYVRDRLPRNTGHSLHFLTHSLGGLVLRYLLQVARPVNLGRVVMLSPPNQGSQLARRFGRNPLYRLATGPSGAQLASEPSKLASLLGPVDYPLGVITGAGRINPLSLLLRGRSDGKVAVDEARVPGMTDFLVVPRSHTFIMNDPEVIAQAVRFFRTGRFFPPARAASAT